MNLRKTLSITTTFLLALLAFSPLATNAQDSEVAVQELRIHTVLEETGEPFYDACYQLEGFSNIGCDENADGVIVFSDIPVGEYNLVQTADIGGLQPVGEPGVDLSNLTVHADDINDYQVTLLDAGESTDLGLITRDPETGEVLAGACYELVGYSNVGCDDDGDGTIMFQDIPWGTYTVHQTETPEGYEPMGDYEIFLEPFPQVGNDPVIIPLVQAESQGGENAVNLSVLVIDAETGNRVANEETCVQFPGMSNPGCDDDVTDGQIDFIGVDPTFGQPTFEVESLACGYEQAAPAEVHMHKYGEFHTVLVLSLNVVLADCPDN